MTDIAARLRQGVDPDDIRETERAMDTAAAEIERLRAAMLAAIREDYRAADGPGDGWRLAYFRVKGILRKALEPAP